MAMLLAARCSIASVLNLIAFRRNEARSAWISESVFSMTPQYMTLLLQFKNDPIPAQPVAAGQGLVSVSGQGRVKARLSAADAG
jgi:hypothetical protein